MNNFIMKNEDRIIGTIIILFRISIALIPLRAIDFDSLFPLKFERIYNEYCKYSWAEVADDGSYLLIDTNPKDIDDHIEMDAYYAIEKVNEELGFPESVFKKMGETRSLDGRQSATAGDITVSWTYHPDNGTEVMYEKTK